MESMERLSSILRFTGVEWLASELGIPSPSSLAEMPQMRHDLGEVIAFPGLTNSHDHLEFNCYPPTGSPPYRDFVEWSSDVQARRDLVQSIEAIPRETRVRFGLLKNLLWGITAVADHGGKPRTQNEPVTVLSGYRSLHSPEFEPWGRFKLLAGNRPAVVHIGEGTSTESHARARAFLRWNLLRRPVAGVHAIGFRQEDFDRLSALIWCPASNLFLFDRTADVAMASHRTRILFGTDATLSAPGTIWDHLRRVRGMLADRDILASLTVEAARFWHLPQSRWQEDFVVARRRKADKWDAFFALTPQDILLVVHGGEIVVVDPSLADVPPAGFHPVAGKYVRMPIQSMLSDLEAAAPLFDRAALIERFRGAIQLEG